MGRAWSGVGFLVLHVLEAVNRYEVRYWIFRDGMTSPLSPVNSLVDLKL